MMNKKLSILFLLTQDIESPSGLGRYFPLAKQLSALGNKVTILALHSNYSELQQKRIVQDGVVVWYIGQMHVKKTGNVKEYFSTFELIVKMLWVTIKMLFAALSIDADIVHVGKPHPMNSLVGLFRKVFSKCQLYIDLDDYELASIKNSSKLYKYIIKFFEDNVPFWADFITTNTYFNKKRLLINGIEQEKVYYLPNGIDPDRFSTIYNNVNTVKEKLKIEDHEKVIIYVGSLSRPSHPVEILIDSFTIVKKAEPHAKLIIVGGGDDYFRLQQKARKLDCTNDIVFTGRINPEEIPQFYRIAHVSVDPVFEDEIAKGRCPLKMFESWFCNIPFVTADVGDRKELIGKPPAGLLAKPGDPISLAEAILEVLNNSSLAQSLISNGKLRVKNYYYTEIGYYLNTIYQHNYYFKHQIKNQINDFRR